VNFLAEIAAWSVLGFGVLLFILQALAYEAGFWIGRRTTQDIKEAEAGIGVIVGALLALLAFVLALTLSFANARFDERRQGGLNEANAIGTAWLRAEALGQPRGDEIAGLLLEYGKLRRENIMADRGSSSLGETNERVSALQNEIWGHLTAVTRDQQNPITASLQAAVNDVFDATTAERLAFAFRFPPQLVWLLLGLALLGMGAVGYQLSLRGNRFRFIAAVVMVAWSLVIVDILDLGAPRIGTFRTSPQAYDWNLSGMGQPIPIPSLPNQRP
jgi:hypothetical protein